MKKVAVFAGSFDPFTVGHESVVRRALPLFDKIIIAVGFNQEKKQLFSIEKRMAMIYDVFNDEPKVSIDKYTGLTVDYCRKIGAKYLLRGLRTAADFEFERAIAQLNKNMYPEVESIFILALPEHTPVNSTIVRDIIRFKGDASKFLPKKTDLKKYL
jgi:pantetheine-phosphate adenylyltransferase